MRSNAYRWADNSRDIILESHFINLIAHVLLKPTKNRQFEAIITWTTFGGLIYSENCSKAADCSREFPLQDDANRRPWFSCWLAPTPEPGRTTVLFCNYHRPSQNRYVDIFWRRQGLMVQQRICIPRWWKQTSFCMLLICFRNQTLLQEHPLLKLSAT